jgi:Flp pilus assembly protein TadG
MKTKRAERGAAALEFGLSFLIFFALVCGVMEFGRIVASYNILAGATREGLRYATLHGSSSGAAASSTDIQTIVRNWSVGLDRNAVLVTTTWSPNNAPGSTVHVRAQYSLTPFMGLILQNSLTLQSNSEQVISQ